MFPNPIAEPIEASMNDVLLCHSSFMGDYTDFLNGVNRILLTSAAYRNRLPNARNSP